MNVVPALLSFVGGGLNNGMCLGGCLLIITDDHAPLLNFEPLGSARVRQTWVSAAAASTSDKKMHALGKQDKPLSKAPSVQLFLEGTTLAPDACKDTGQAKTESSKSRPFEPLPPGRPIEHAAAAAAAATMQQVKPSAAGTIYIRLASVERLGTFPLCTLPLFPRIPHTPHTQQGTAGASAPLLFASFYRHCPPRPHRRVRLPLKSRARTSACPQHSRTQPTYNPHTRQGARKASLVYSFLCKP